MWELKKKLWAKDILRDGVKDEYLDGYFIAPLGISEHGIDRLLPEYFCFNTKRVILNRVMLKWHVSNPDVEIQPGKIIHTIRAPICIVTILANSIDFHRILSIPQ